MWPLPRPSPAPNSADDPINPEALDEQIRVPLMSYTYGWKSNADEKYVLMQIAKDVHSPDRWRTNAQVNQIYKWYSLFNVTHSSS